MQHSPPPLGYTFSGTQNHEKLQCKSFEPLTSWCGDTRAANTIERALLRPPFPSASAIVTTIVSIT